MCQRLEISMEGMPYILQNAVLVIFTPVIVESTTWPSM